MNGATNAAPAAGGLKVIASGTITGLTSDLQNLEMPSAALLVIANLYSGSGTSYMNSAVALRGSLPVAFDNKTAARIGLSEDGMILSYMGDIPSSNTRIDYFAFA